MIHSYLLFPLIHNHMPMQGWTLSRLPPISMATRITEQNVDILLLYKQHSSASYRTLWNRKKRKIYFHVGKRYRLAEADCYTGLHILHNCYNVLFPVDLILIPCMTFSPCSLHTIKQFCDKVATKQWLHSASTCHGCQTAAKCEVFVSFIAYKFGKKHWVYTDIIRTDRSHC